MVDYSRASVSKSSKESFDKAASNVIEYINELQETYETTWSELESLRKERAAIIEKIIQVLKNTGVKLSKPLGRCNNSEINQELTRILDGLPFNEREEVQVAIVRINNRYEEILKKGQILDSLNEELSHTRVLEPDSKEEVVISLSDYKKTNGYVDPSLEKVDNISKASDELISSLEDLISSKRVIEMPIENDTKNIVLENDENTNEVNSESETIPLLDAELEELYKLGEYLEDDLAIEQYLEEQSVEAELEDFAVHTMKKDQTLSAIADNVYGDEKYWEDLYNYKDNKEKIDARATEKNVSVSKAAHTIGILTDLELKFPAELITYEEITEKGLGKAA